MQLSIVTTWFQATDSLPEFCDRMHTAARALTKDYELVWVFDGSSADVAKPFVGERVRLVVFPEHRGEYAARLAGLAAARGEMIYLTPGDLEVAPEAVAIFWEAWQAIPVTEVVIGRQKTRRGDWSERLSGEIFYRLYNSIARHPIPASPAGCYLFTRAATRKLLVESERSVLFLAAVIGSGLRKEVVLVEKTRRQTSTYGWPGKLTLALRALRRSRK